MSAVGQSLRSFSALAKRRECPAFLLSLENQWFHCTVT
jgi:hypothetical protein